MPQPPDIPDDVWLKAYDILESIADASWDLNDVKQTDIARGFMAEREQAAKIAEKWGAKLHEPAVGGAIATAIRGAAV